MSTDTKSTEKKSDKPPIPPVVVYGPAGCGKTTLADLFMKFFGTTTLVDGYAEASGDKCEFASLKPGTLYLTTKTFTEEEHMHAGLAHGVVVVDFYTTLRDLGGAKGRTATEYFTELLMKDMIRGVLGGSRRGRSRSPFEF